MMTLCVYLCGDEPKKLIYDCGEKSLNKKNPCLHITVVSVCGDFVLLVNSI